MPSAKEVITNHNQFYLEFPSFEREMQIDEEGNTKTVKLFAMSFVAEGSVDNFILEDAMREDVITKLMDGMTSARKRKLAAQITNGKRPTPAKSVAKKG